jgi:hypothetical protein
MLMKAIVIVYYKIVKKTIDILHKETIWVKWEFLFQAICEIALTMFRPWLSPESGYNYQESLDSLADVLFLMILIHAWY